jgi:hypothetical protein
MVPIRLEEHWPRSNFHWLMAATCCRHCAPVDFGHRLECSASLHHLLHLPSEAAARRTMSWMQGMPLFRACEHGLQMRRALLSGLSIDPCVLPFLFFPSCPRRVCAYRCRCDSSRYALLSLRPDLATAPWRLRTFSSALPTAHRMTARLRHTYQHNGIR